ncbi:RNA polymerase sigma-70 factor [uncultured Sunxiuqinia sp.]|uniref:RNA polymerase sigma-70 factor n=1 Tax=uncultured Sunxiuqinia sp. TaxID=1573825 RepID=UPI002639EE05|nr:RNA polymerase sigma-70 factor [uncultured Sunxiuqinia sp.]
MRKNDKIESFPNALDNYSSFQQLFESYYGRLCAYVFSLTHNHAASEDIVQELFIRLWNDRARISIQENILAYLFRASRNSALNYLRGEANRDKQIKKLNIQDSMVDRNFLEEEEFVSFLEDCIDDLPERCQQVFRMSRFEGCKQAEIADQLGTSVKTIKNQIWKSLQYLRTCLEAKDAF